MNWKSGYLSVLLPIAVSLLVFFADSSNYVSPSYAQPASVTDEVPIVTNLDSNVNDELRVHLDIYGINSSTGLLFGFLRFEDQVMHRIVNSSEADLDNGILDGIAAMRFGILNTTVSPGQPYDVCLVVLNEKNMMCKTSYKSPVTKGEYIGMDISRHED